MKVAILGGGVIGLSLAWELAGRGHAVTLIERGRFGRKASWAGAGILLPGNNNTSLHPMEKLESLSNTLHREWSEKLRDQTGIDNGYRECGGVYVARTVGEKVSLIGSLDYWQQREISAVPLSAEQFRDRCPAVSTTVAEAEHFAAVELPEESQICNPWHLNALIAACRDAGVELIDQQVTTDIEATGESISGIRLAERVITADAFCFACGAWTESVLNSIDVSLPMTPVRGQMVLFRADTALPLPIVNEGIRYVVPRPDGHVLVGATVEEVGFDETTVDADIESLIQFALNLLPSLSRQDIVKTWAGLRPGTWDGFPYLGPVPGFANAMAVTGHFRTGLQLSTGTARVMADLLEDRSPTIDLAPFSLSRVGKHDLTDLRRSETL